MKRLLIVALFITGIATESDAQCKLVKTGLKALNNNLIDSARSTIDSASVIIKSNGVESVSDWCLSKYFYAKAVIGLMDGRELDSLDQKVKYFDESLYLYEQFLKLDDRPKNLDKSTQSNLISLAIEYINVGVEYYQVQKYAYALNYVEKGLGMKKKYDATTIKEQDYFNALVCAKMMKNFPRALVYADSLLAKEKLSTEKKIKFLEQKTEVLSAAGQDSSAMLLLDSLEVLGGDKERIQMAKLQIHMNKNENEEALQVMNTLISRTTNKPDLWNIKAQLEYELKMVDSAIVSFGNTLQLDEKNYSALYGLGVIHVNKGNRNVELMNKAELAEIEQFREQVRLDYGVAIGYFDKILADQPKDLNVLNALLAIYSSLGDEANQTVIKEKIKIANSAE